MSQSNLDQVKQYIAVQEEHHHKIGFQDELRALLRKHEIEWFVSDPLRWNSWITYRIERNENLDNPLWVQLGSATADASGVFQFIDTPPIGSPRRYYRSVYP